MKILVLRFSSIGDIVLTTPIIRCLKKQVEEIQIHYLTKAKFKPILINNPYIDKIHSIEKSTKEVLNNLKAEKFDFIIDLHNNIRTLALKIKLNKKSYSFPKLNFKKWLLVNLKINQMPQKHIVERYFETVKFLNVQNDFESCDYFISENEKVDIQQTFGFENYIAIAIGGQFFTKRMPFDKLSQIIEKLNLPIILLGDKNDRKIAKKICERFSKKSIVNTCGDFSINQSASIVQQTKVLLTNDTGLMHIASAFNQKIVSVWGNTVPEFGMYPYMPKKKQNYSIHQVQGLSCRPCSKIGFRACPKKHFKCMNLQDENKIVKDIEKTCILS